MTKAPEKRCGTCRFIHAVSDKDGKRRVLGRSHTYPCTAPIPAMPAMPDSITGYFGFKVPTDSMRRNVSSHGGTTCPTWQPYVKPSVADKGLHSSTAELIKMDSARLLELLGECENPEGDGADFASEVANDVDLILHDRGLEIEVRDGCCVNVTPWIFRSWGGRRRIAGKAYAGPVFYLGSKKVAR